MAIELYLNGIRVGNGTESTHIRLNKWPSNGYFVIGQYQDKLGSGFEKFQSYSGDLTGIELWDYVLDETTIKRISGCGGISKGNVLNWETAKWITNGKINSSLIDNDELCNERAEKNYIIIPQQQSLNFSGKICEKLGGLTILPKTAYENSLILNITLPYHDICKVQDEGGKITWLRLRSNENGGWIDPKTKNKPLYNNWKKGKHVESDDNCAFLVENGKWSSTTCNEQSPRTLCTMCQFPKSYNIYSLRGLCAESKHDSVYFLERTAGQMPFFKGLSSSVIRWNQELQTWKLTHLRYNSTGMLAEDAVVSF